MVNVELVYCLVSILIDIIMENEFYFCVSCSNPFIPNHYLIPLTLGKRQAQRNTTSSPDDFGT